MLDYLPNFSYVGLLTCPVSDPPGAVGNGSTAEEPGETSKKKKKKKKKAGGTDEDYLHPLTNPTGVHGRLVSMATK